MNKEQSRYHTGKEMNRRASDVNFNAQDSIKIQVFNFYLRFKTFHQIGEEAKQRSSKNKFLEKYEVRMCYISRHHHDGSSTAARIRGKRGQYHNLIGIVSWDRNKEESSPRRWNKKQTLKISNQNIEKVSKQRRRNIGKWKRTWHDRRWVVVTGFLPDWWNQKNVFLLGSFLA